jgi:hypothetical protein
MMIFEEATMEDHNLETSFVVEMEMTLSLVLVSLQLPRLRELEIRPKALKQQLNSISMEMQAMTKSGEKTV